MEPLAASDAPERPVITVEQHRTLPPDVAVELRRIYLAAFEPMRSMSFTRIVMTDDEWDAMVVHNEHALKHVGYVDGVLGGVLVSTDRPDLIDWVSMEFLAAHYPEAVAAGTLRYVLTLAVDPPLLRSGIFRRLADDFILDTDWQAAVYDVCRVNTFIHDVITRSAMAVGYAREDGEPSLDAQTVYGWRHLDARVDGG